MSPTYLDHFWSISTKNNFRLNLGHLARVTFQFLAQEQSARKVLADMNAFSGRTFRGLVGTRAVLAGVAEKPLENRLEHLNVPLAVGPSFFCAPGGECFAPRTFYL